MYHDLMTEELERATNSSNDPLKSSLDIRASRESCGYNIPDSCVIDFEVLQLDVAEKGVVGAADDSSGYAKTGHIDTENRRAQDAGPIEVDHDQATGHGDGHVIPEGRKQRQWTFKALVQLPSPRCEGIGPYQTPSERRANASVAQQPPCTNWKP